MILRHFAKVRQDINMIHYGKVITTKHQDLQN